MGADIELPVGVRPLSEDIEEEEAAAVEEPTGWDELALTSVQ